MVPQDPGSRAAGWPANGCSGDRSSRWIRLTVLPYEAIDPDAVRNAYTPTVRRRVVVDLQETPAVPPFDPQGDPRLGYFIGGGLLIFLGWGMGVIANLLLHEYSPVGGFTFLGLYFARTLGVYSCAVLGFGLFTGAFGVVLLGLGRASPKGPIVLPGVGS